LFLGALRDENGFLEIEASVQNSSGLFTSEIGRIYISELTDAPVQN
jgi:hypothetical protein